MSFWISILTGLIVAYFYSKKGVYEAIIFLFNLSLSIYLALYIMPSLIKVAPYTIDIPGGLILTLLIVSIAIMAVFCAVSFILFTGQLSVPMGRLVDWLGGSILGFFVGFLGISFVFTLPTLEPIPGVSAFIQDIETTANINMVCYMCDKVNYYIGKDRVRNTKNLLAWLQTQVYQTNTSTIDPNDPNVAEPNKTD